MGEEMDRKVQEAVDKVAQGFDEWVSSAVTKALKKWWLRIKCLSWHIGKKLAY